MNNQNQSIQKSNNKSILKSFFTVCLSLFIILALFSLAGYTYILQRQINISNENIKKISTQLATIKDASVKQLEGSTEIQNKINNITTKQNQLSNNTGIGSLTDLSKTIVKIYNISKTSLSSGTGTIIDKQGHILTNKHVIDETNIYDTKSILAVCITSNPDQNPVCSYTAEIVGIGEGDVDLALLKIDKKLETNDNGRFTISPLTSAPQINFKDILTQNNAKPDLGSQINVLGYPGVGGDSISLTRGIYSGSVDELYFKTDAKVNSGNSGGAAFDSNNNFLGVPTAVSGGQGNIGYIIKSDKVVEFIKANIQ